MTTANTFTEQQVQDYLDRHIEKINRKAFAYQDVLLNVQKKGDSFEQSMDWESFENMEEQSQDIIVYVSKIKNDPTSNLKHHFKFRNLQDEELGQLLIDTFITAGLPEDKRTILELMFNLEREYNIPDTVVIDITGGVVDEITSNMDVDVIVLDADLESLDEDDLKRAIDLNGTTYVPHNTGVVINNPKRISEVHQAVYKK